MLLLAGLIIWSVLSMAAVILVVLKNSALRDAYEREKVLSRLTRQNQSAAEDDLRRTQADLREVITAWGEMGTKHARRRLKQRLSSSLGQRYASALSSMEVPTMYKPENAPKNAVEQEANLDDYEIEMREVPKIMGIEN